MQRRQLKLPPLPVIQEPPAPPVSTALFQPLALRWDNDGTVKAEGPPSARQLRVMHVMARQNMSDDNIAFCVGLSIGDFRAWQQEYPAVRAAVDAGRAAGEELATRVIYSGIKNGDVQCAKFVLQSKYNWRQQDGGNSSPPPSQQRPPDAFSETLKRLTDEEVRDIASAIARAAGRAVIDG